MQNTNHKTIIKGFCLIILAFNKNDKLKLQFLFE